MKSLLLFSLLFSATSHASTLDQIKSQLKSTPYLGGVPQGNEEIFDKYCVGDSTSAEVPQPNYKNDLVLLAAKKLTQTKIDADAKLSDKKSEEFKQSLQTIIESLETMTNGGASAEVKNLAQAIVDQISLSPEPTLTKEIQNLFKDLSQTLGGDLYASIKALDPRLAKELKAVDVPVLVAALKNLQLAIEKELKQPEFAVLKTAFESLHKTIQKNVKPIDQQGLLASMKNLKSEIPKANNFTDGPYVLQRVDEVINAIQSNQFTQDTLWSVQSMSWSLKEAKNLFTPQGQVYVDQALAYADQVNVQDLATTANTLAVKFANKDLTNNWEFTSFIEVVDDMYTNQNNGVFTAQDVPAIQKYRGESVKFQNDDIKQNVANALNYLTTGSLDQDSGIYYARSAAALLAQMKDLTPSTKNLVGTVNAEVSKSESSNIVNYSKESLKALETSKGLLNQDSFSSVSNLGWSLKGNANSLDVAPDTLDYVGVFLSLYEAAELWSQINYAMTGSTGDTKESQHFYFYGGVRRMYVPSNKASAEALAVGANREAHLFLTQLCGEFRDRATMIESKLNWIKNLYTLPAKTETVNNPDQLAGVKNVWAHVNASAYYPYITLSSALWTARRSSLTRYIQVGNQQVDNPVPGTTVCEVKYIFANYVGKNKTFDDLDQFNQGYDVFKQGCPKADLTDYYDFRGDSNFKQYSPESNGMIWYATTIAAACTSPTQAKGKVYSDADCENYFKRPFAYRYSAARAGLAAWLFRDPIHADVFSSQGSMVAIYPHSQPELAPYSFGFDANSTAGAVYDYDPEWLAIAGAWNTPSIGFNDFTGISYSKSPDAQESAYVRIRDAVDRHTDWYNSGYNDNNGGTKSQAYSPFVASSYEMSSSDSFTTCGITVQCPPDGLKRWMFVFRVKAQNWYTPQSILDGVPVDFDKMWFDETSFGVSGLADSEHAWDRLGSPVETELDSILYLIHVDGGGFGGDMEGMQDFEGEDGAG